MLGIRQSPNNTFVLFRCQWTLYEIVELSGCEQQLTHDRPLRTGFEGLPSVGNRRPERLFAVQIVPTRIVFTTSNLHSQLRLQNVEDFMASVGFSHE